MKKLIILSIVLIGFCFAQQTFESPVIKPPVLMGKMEVILERLEAPALDSNEVVIPDSFKVSKGVKYKIWLYNEDDEMVKFLKGDLKPFLKNSEKAGLNDFIDALTLRAKPKILGQE